MKQKSMVRVQKNMNMERYVKRCYDNKIKKKKPAYKMQLQSRMVVFWNFYEWLISRKLINGWMVKNGH